VCRWERPSTWAEAAAPASPHTPIASIGTSSQPEAWREAKRGACRKQSAPMNTPCSRFLRTPYHMVEASRGPWMRCQGGRGSPRESSSPASMS
jgi:hypothetical protein